MAFNISAMSACFFQRTISMAEFLAGVFSDAIPFALAGIKNVALFATRSASLMRSSSSASLRADDLVNLLVAELAVFLAEIFAELGEPLRGVNELNLAAPILRLAVGQHPDVCGDAGVVEQIFRQGDGFIH
jgi:hypothetical protein